MTLQKIFLLEFKICEKHMSIKYRQKIVRYCYLLFDIRIFDQTYNTKDNTVQSLLITFAEVNAHSPYRF